MRRLTGQVSWSEAHNLDGSLRPGFADVEHPDVARERAKKSADEQKAEALRTGSPRYRENDHLANAVAAKVDRWLRDTSGLPEEIWDHIAVMACREVAREMGVSSQRVALASWNHDDHTPVSFPVPWSRYPAKRKKKTKPR